MSRMHSPCFRWNWKGNSFRFGGNQPRRKTPGIKLSSMACLRVLIGKESCENSHTVSKNARRTMVMGINWIRPRTLSAVKCHFLCLMGTTSKPPHQRHLSTHAKGLENSLNKNHEYMPNRCRVFHLDYNPSKNKQMDRVWTQFIKTGCSKLVLGLRSKIFVLPAPGQQAPNQITLIRQYMKFNFRYTSVSRIMSHATVTNLDKALRSRWPTH
jgi:hypothetical protein